MRGYTLVELLVIFVWFLIAASFIAVPVKLLFFPELKDPAPVCQCVCPPPTAEACPYVP